METTRCNLCGSSNSYVLHKIDVTDRNLKYFLYVRNIPNKQVMTGQFTIVKCKDCGLVYTNPRCTGEELDLLYSSNKHLGGNWRNWQYLFNLTEPDELQSSNGYNPDFLAKVPKWLQWQVDIIEPYRKEYLDKHPSELQLLDVGCGYGAFMKAATDASYDVYGCDLASDRVKLARETYMLSNIFTGSAEQHFQGQQFDIITLWDVIEHVTEPKEFLNKLRLFLKPGGLIFIYTMSLDSLTYKLFRSQWYYLDPIGHLYYFSDSTIRQMIESSGYKFLGKELDDSKHVSLRSFLLALREGILNHIVFYGYRFDDIWAELIRRLLRKKQGNIPRERILKRMENLFPYILPIRYRDDFIYVGLNKDKTGIRVFQSG